MRPYLLVLLLLLVSCASDRQNAFSDRTPGLGVADVALANGAPDIALRIAQQVAVADPHNVRALVLMANAQAASGQPGMSARTFAQALAVVPDDAEALIGLGRLKLTTDPAAAAKIFVQITTQDSKNVAALIDLGIARDLLGQHSEAQGAYRRALAIEPGRSAASVNLGLSLALSGDPLSALTILRPLAEGPATSPKIRQNFAVALALSGSNNEAAAILKTDMPQQEALATVAGYHLLHSPGEGLDERKQAATNVRLPRDGRESRMNQSNARVVELGHGQRSNPRSYASRSVLAAPEAGIVLDPDRREHLQEHAVMASGRMEGAKSPPADITNNRDVHSGFRVADRKALKTGEHMGAVLGNQQQVAHRHIASGPNEIVSAGYSRPDKGVTIGTASFALAARSDTRPGSWVSSVATKRQRLDGRIASLTLVNLKSKSIDRFRDLSVMSKTNLSQRPSQSGSLGVKLAVIGDPQPEHEAFHMSMAHYVLSDSETRRHWLSRQRRVVRALAPKHIAQAFQASGTAQAVKPAKTSIVLPARICNDRTTANCPFRSVTNVSPDIPIDVPHGVGQVVTLAKWGHTVASLA